MRLVLGGNVSAMSQRGNWSCEQVQARNELAQTIGPGEIRTHETLSGLPVFKTGAFNRSATGPCKFQGGEDVSSHLLGESLRLRR